MKTYLIYQKTGRALRVQAATIGLVRDGVVVLHNAEGQATAVFSIADTVGIVEEDAVAGEVAESKFNLSALSDVQVVPKTKSKASAKSAD